MRDRVDGSTVSYARGYPLALIAMAFPKASRTEHAITSISVTPMFCRTEHAITCIYLRHADVLSLSNDSVWLLEEKEEDHQNALLSSQCKDRALHMLY